MLTCLLLFMLVALAGWLVQCASVTLPLSRRLRPDNSTAARNYMHNQLQACLHAERSFRLAACLRYVMHACIYAETVGDNIGKCQNKNFLMPIRYVDMVDNYKCPRRAYIDAYAKVVALLGNGELHSANVQRNSSLLFCNQKYFIIDWDCTQIGLHAGKYSDKTHYRIAENFVRF